MDPHIYSQQLRPLPQTQYPKNSITLTRQGNFHEILQTEINSNQGIKLSKHAEKRLQERGISIDQDKWSLIQDKLSEAKLKGINDSLVVLSNAALVVNAKSNTVITALGREEANSQIFTNINGTILID
ncbi:TIGR02530 family flagellar biosynthesis protein [Alkalihalobacterium alkalinitrilicum]|uniref:TIGR02530 family flagellar biosynthesis protein n=1 Tax=Alkalihalobacterium alkalinitrilicum TaxID=427920 RepID=UPI000994E977|nr:TIGR02530 family flagellar biosynthesis protein [Alkalihalobacterium alkalinitrilicum]